MRIFLWILLVVGIVLVVGCSTKKKDDKPGPLTTKCVPPGGDYMNGSSVNVTLTAFKKNMVISGATIHYGIDNPAAGLTAIDTVSFTIGPASDKTITVYYWSEWTDPNTGVTEKENGGVPKEAKFVFKPDWLAPTVSISPSGGKYEKRSDVNPITVSAQDGHSNVTLYYRTQSDGGGWSSWQSVGGSAKTASTQLTWQDSVMVFEVEAYAQDAIGNKSGTASAKYEIDLTLMAKKVMELINEKRAQQNPPLQALSWDNDLANACKTHAEQLAADPINGSKYSPGDAGADGKKLSDRTGYSVAYGGKGSKTAEDIFNLWWNNAGIRDMMLDKNSATTKFGCGFETKYWIWIAAQR
ncbi:MAG: CAP domain-containing protein [Planctomycetota bacterium]|nr:CAP domain-containing protein [Planctomycetota bacterium]